MHVTDAAVHCLRRKGLLVHHTPYGCFELRVVRPY